MIILCYVVLCCVVLSITSNTSKHGVKNKLSLQKIDLKI